MANKVLFTSNKGGVGVTTVCINLAYCFAEEGLKTLIVDGDEKSSCTLTVAGCANLQVFNFDDLKNGACRAKQLLIEHPTKPNLYFLSTQNCFDQNLIERAVLEVEGLFDFIFLDKCCEKICDRAVVILEPFAPSIKSANDKICELDGNKIKDIGVIINRVNGGHVYDGEIMPPQEIAYLLRRDLCAVIPEDLLLPLGKIKLKTLKSFKCAALSLLKKSNKIYPVIKGYYGVYGYFKRKLRRAL